MNASQPATGVDNLLHQEATDYMRRHKTCFLSIHHQPSHVNFTGALPICETDHYDLNQLTVSDNPRYPDKGRGTP